MLRAEPGFHPGGVGARDAQLPRATAYRRPPLRFGSASARSSLRASQVGAPPPGMNPGRTGATFMTRQEGPNRSSTSGRERKRKAGMGRPIQAVREARPAGRGDSLVPHTSTSTNRADVYSRITAEIVVTIERGAGEWRAPWFHDGASVARPMSHPANAIEVSTRWPFGRLGSSLNMATASGEPTNNGRRPAHRSAKGNAPP